MICSISVPPDVDPDTIELGWLNEDDIITDDSRVTIIESMHDSTNNVITTVIQFDPLYEDDEGTYSCYSIVDEVETFASVQLQIFRSEQVTLYFPIPCTVASQSKSCMYRQIMIYSKAISFC